MKHTQKTKAFTLIELLIVIAILGILAALLLPTLGKAQIRAKTTKCIGNSKAVGTAALGFASSNLGKFPEHNGTDPWMKALRDELGEPGSDSIPVYGLECPEMSKFPLSSVADTHYAFNDALIYGGDDSDLPTLPKAKQRSIKLQEIDSPTECIMFVGCTDNALITKTSFSSVKFLHGGDQVRGTMAFSDGHAVARKYTDVTGLNGTKSDAFWKPKP